LVIFGSKSDIHVFDKITRSLNENKVDNEVRVLSAHRTPDEVDKVISNGDFAVVIAGAGLSAALPGVVASKTLKPVIGVPVSGNYEGLDALLSIMQMPPGIPVLGVGVEETSVAVDMAKLMLKNYVGINIVGNKEDKVVKKATDILDKLGVNYQFSDSADLNGINIEFTLFDEPIEKKDALIIYCPMLLKDDDKAEAALNILKHSGHGLWVGLNRGDNAAIAAVEILNIDGKFDDKLKGLREEGKEKVLKGDEEVKNDS